MWRCLSAKARNLTFLRQPGQPEKVLQQGTALNKWVFGEVSPWHSFGTHGREKGILVRRLCQRPSKVGEGQGGGRGNCMEKEDSRTLKRKVTEEEGRALHWETVPESEGGIRDRFSDVSVMASTQTEVCGEEG